MDFRAGRRRLSRAPPPSQAVQAVAGRTDRDEPGASLGALSPEIRSADRFPRRRPPSPDFVASIYGGPQRRRISAAARELQGWISRRLRILLKGARPVDETQFRMPKGVSNPAPSDPRLPGVGRCCAASGHQCEHFRLQQHEATIVHLQHAAIFPLSENSVDALVGHAQRVGKVLL